MSGAGHDAEAVEEILCTSSAPPPDIPSTPPGRGRAARPSCPEAERATTQLWFHSRTPHRSGPNTSASARRALYPTYNARSEGDLRTEYYAAKRARFAAGAGRDDGKVQVSLIDDFQGRSV